MAEQHLVNLGQVPPETAMRDTIHIAVAPVEAGEDMEAGDHFLMREGKAYATMSINPACVGVVDPFLRGGEAVVRQGQVFWGLLYPGTVTNLRHSWTHPAFKPRPLTFEEIQKEIRKRMAGNDRP